MRRVRWMLMGALLAAVVAPAAAPALEVPKSLGGTVLDGTQAPWNVLLLMRGDGECSGSLIAPDEVVTAAHCVVDAAYEPIPAADVFVAAGVIDGAARPAQFETGARAAQVRLPASFRSDHFPDVAHLRLVRPLALSARVGTISLAAPTSVQAGTASAYGFGTQGDGRADYLLRVVPGMTVGTGCFEGVLLSLCGRSTVGGSCPGDSGGPLTSDTSPPTLIGVSVSIRPPCGPNGLVMFTNATVPEIGSFLRGDDNPPRAPRLVARPVLKTTPGTTTCDGGRWSDATALSYSFWHVNESGARTLTQSGTSDRLVVPDGAPASWVACEVTASSAGGIGRASSVEPVWAEPREDPQLDVFVEGGRVIADSVIGRGVQLMLIVKRGSREVHRKSFDSAAAPRLPSLSPGAYDVCVEVPEGGIWRPLRVCTTHRVDGKASDLVSAGLTRSRALVLRVRPAARGAVVTVRWRYASCTRARCRSRRAVQRLRLAKRTTVAAPSQAARRRGLVVTIALPPIVDANQTRYVSGRLRLVAPRR